MALGVLFQCFKMLKKLLFLKLKLSIFIYLYLSLTKSNFPTIAGNFHSVEIYETTSSPREFPNSHKGITEIFDMKIQLRLFIIEVYFNEFNVLVG